MPIRVLIVVLLALSQVVKGQTPVADFTANQTSGCSPLNISFTDRSTGSPKFWSWDFGNGQLSNQQNPVVTYTTPGTYTVKLVVRNASGTNGVTKTDYITINPSPNVSFSANITAACAPSDIKFTDLSNSGGAGTINAWEWNFGDGTTSTSQNPTHRYTEPGFYTISLKVTSSTGCTATATVFRYVRIVSGVVSDFVNTPPATCRAPFTSQFHNQSSGPGTLSYNWDFGNGITSTQDNPAPLFNTAGTTTVRLITTSDYGCADTVSKDVALNGIITAFNGDDSACINSLIVFNDASSSPPVSTRWQIADSAKGGVSASYFFKTAGVFPVKMVNKYATCTDSVTRNVTIGNVPTVDFTSTGTGSCKGPFDVTFQNLTPNTVSVQWDFGDGNTSTQLQPTHTYTAPGQYTVTLKVVDVFGCENSTAKTGYVQIVPPTVSIANAPTGGCIPYTFNPVANVNAIDGVSQYSWDFGDGTVLTGQSPAHTYTNAGTYNLSLTITTTGGCTQTVNLPAGVKTGTPVPVDFTVYPTQSCASAPILFTPTSTANEFAWDFGDGQFSNEKNPTHIYADTGTFNVTVSAINNGCPNPFTKSNVVTIYAPIASFEDSVNCSANEVIFTNTSKTDAGRGTITYSWDFGDGNTSTQKDPRHPYATTGAYNVTLTVTNDTCSHTFSKTINLLNEKADFSVDKATVCRNAPFTLSATNSNASNIQSYLWQVGNYAPFTGDRSASTSIDSFGVFDVRLTITDINGCTNSLSKTNVVSVTGPTADFRSAVAIGCTNSTVTFNDLSTSSAPLVKWSWDFGDGKTQDFTKAPFTHNYSDTGSFTVKLTVQDANGCTSIQLLPNAVRVNKVAAFFRKDTTMYCPGLPVQFNDSSTGANLQYLWNFGDGTTSTQQNPLHSFPAGDKSYSISLRVIDSSGCSDSMSRANYITIATPFADFDITDTLTICPPLETKFFFKGKNYESFYWDFGDGSDISLQQDPRHFYNSFGEFTPKLYVVGFGGCIDSVSKNVHVTDPNTTTFQYTPLDACNRLTVNFNVKTPGSTNYILLFGDGSIDTTQSGTFSHFYPSPAFYFPYLSITDRTGCQVNLSGASPIRVIGAQPLFGVDRKEFCDSGTVFFTNYTIYNDPIASYRWDFGDGTTSSNPDEIHTFTEPGTYITKLVANTQSGCTDSIADTIRVYRTPLATIITRDSVCANSFSLFQSNLLVADTAVFWNWNFGNGQTSTAPSTSSMYSQPGAYTVTLDSKNSFGCASQVSRQIHVLPLPTIELTGSPVVLAGRGASIPITYTGAIASYNWSPPTGLSCIDCPSPFARPSKTTDYTVTVTDSFGCKASRLVTVPVVCTERNLFVPNTFSPNGDGVNDVFFPEGVGVFTIKSFRVFNRWGQMVFERTNFTANQSSMGWDGTFRGKKAEPDVYIYNVEIICVNGQVVPYSGNVMLLR